MAYIQISQVLESRGISVNQRYEDVIAEQRFLGALEKFIRKDGSILLHVNSSDGYWNSLQGASILQVAIDGLLRKATGTCLYGGSGFVRLYPDDAIEYWCSKNGPAYAIYHGSEQGLLLMNLGEFLDGQRPSKAVQ